MSGAPAGLLVAEFRKQFRGGAVVDVAFRQPAAGPFVTVLFGPSGCGKTTVLRSLAGLERPERGRIDFAGEAWFDAAAGISLPPQRRNVGYLFQDYALFPHLTVEQNVAYGVKRPPWTGETIVAGIIERFGLGGFEKRRPGELSGGQQQRVALARAIACGPRLLLLDEPLSALDGPTREPLRRELRRLLRAAKIPAVVVTHDRLEAMALADQVIVLHEGAVRQAGTVEQVFGRPADLTVARIVGVETVVRGKVLGVHEGLATVAVGPAQTQVIAVAGEDVAGEVDVCVRAEDVMLQKQAPADVSGRNRLPAVVTAVEPEGPLVRVSLDCGFALTAVITKPAREDLGLAAGDGVVAIVKATAVHLISRG
jgi:molybdate transport system ATP-binding protein